MYKSGSIASQHLLSDGTPQHRPAATWVSAALPPSRRQLCKPPTHQPFMPPRLASRVPSCSHLIAVPHPPTCFCFPPSSSSLHPANAHSSKRVTLTVTRANTSVSLTVCQALARPPYINHPVYSLQQVRGELLPSCPGDVTVQGSGKVSKWPLVFCTSTPSVGRVVVTAN